MTITLDGTSGITTPTYGGAVTGEYTVPVTGFKNRIINGAMMIDQRNAGASVTTGATYAFSLDRWSYGASQASKFTIQQNAGSVTPASGFTNYLGSTSSSAYSIISSDYFYVSQRIEGYNVADLGWGAVGAKTVTLSFQVYSSLTGAFGGAIRNSGASRSYPFSYTVSSANTWTSVSITIPGDTSGTWLTNNGVGIEVLFSLGSGSTYTGTANTWASANYATTTGATSVVGTNGATFYITGVQLEKGSTATSFDYRPYGTELALCQRYYQTGVTGAAGGAGGVSGNGYLGGYAAYQVVMRTAGTLTQSAQYYSNVYNDNITLGTSSPIPSNAANGFGHGAINGGGATRYYFTYTSSAEL